MRLIHEEGLLEAIHDFFVSGSYIMETIAPVYSYNHLNDRPARFDLTLQNDAQLACALTRQVIFHYGPQLWRLGETDLKHAFAAGGADGETAAQSFISSVPRICLPPETKLFRVRRNPECDESLVSASAFDPPPDYVKRSLGRWDDGTHPVLYASDDIELCLHECRVSIADEIVVATLSTRRTLTLLDLTQDLSDAGQTPFEDPNVFVRFLSISRSDEWLEYARLVARLARATGLDGVRYRSYYGQAKHEATALNVALFGRPLANRLLELRSVNRLRLRDARYDYAFGPVLYNDSDMKAELNRYVKQIDLKSVSELLNDSTT